MQGAYVAHHACFASFRFNPAAVSSGAPLLLLQGQRMVGEQDLRVYLDKFDRKYWATYKAVHMAGA